MRQNAFTLVELSIVLVIIGLLIGGVMAGQNLIQASAMRSVIRDAENYGKAVAIFKEKYQELPGDYSSATQQWGTDSHGCPKGYWNERYKGTCNGNGNGAIDSAAGNGSEERWRAWQHLSNAGLMDQALSGGAGPSNETVIGYNIPETKLSGAGFSMIEDVPANMPNDAPQVMLQLGAVNAKLTTNPALRADEAYAIDEKIDDGYPSKGMVQSVSAASPGTCQITATPENAYNLISKQKICALHFLTGIR